MEQDRFASNGTLYIIGIFCLIVCLSLFFFSMYIAPYLIWDLKYDIPEFILQNIEYFQEQYEMTENASRFLVGLMYFIPALIAGYISYYISNKIDNQIFKSEINYDEEEQEKHVVEVKEQLKESASIGFKILMLMIVIVIVIFLLQFFVSLTSTTEG
ncbi:MAG TPA: hypothetical protein PK657_00725 [Legionella sp.]|nr:hypothetical protein [Legionella sp.]